MVTLKATDKINTENTTKSMYRRGKLAKAHATSVLDDANVKTVSVEMRPYMMQNLTKTGIIESRYYGRNNNMIDYSWDKHNEMIILCDKYCELQKTSTNMEKMSSATAHLRNAMYDIYHYFDGKPSRDALLALIRNIDTAIESIRHINNAVFSVGLSNPEKSFRKCFSNPQVIIDFRDLRSLILAHPFDTYTGSGDNKEFKGYLEDIYLNDKLLQHRVGKDCEYVLSIHHPNSDVSQFRGLSHQKDICPVIDEISSGVNLIIERVSSKTSELIEKLKATPLNLDETNIKTYLDSLDQEMSIRCPWEISDTPMIDNEGNEYIEHYNSFLSKCYMYFDMHYSIQDTEAKYQKFLDYIKTELKRIEHDLQSMEIDNYTYFSLENGSFCDGMGYECEKIFYLYESDETSWTTAPISPSCSSNALWGVRCFRKLMPYIEQYFTVDTSVSDKGLYCQYVLAKYLHNTEKMSPKAT